jgi:hypothetical protein
MWTLTKSASMSELRRKQTILVLRTPDTTRIAPKIME